MYICGPNRIQYACGGESFAMIFGIGMAAPLVACLAALIRWKFPSFSLLATGFALSTTTQQQARESNHGTTDIQESTFDAIFKYTFWNGDALVNATAALDRMLIFDCSLESDDTILLFSTPQLSTSCTTAAAYA